MLADGTYRARAIEGALGFTKGDKEQAAILLDVSEGEAEGQRITWFGYFTEKTTDRTMEALRCHRLFMFAHLGTRRRNLHHASR